MINACTNLPVSGASLTVENGTHKRLAIYIVLEICKEVPKQ
jgi:hypothetical protein